MNTYFSIHFSPLINKFMSDGAWKWVISLELYVSMGLVWSNDCCCEIILIHSTAVNPHKQVKA